MGLNFGADGYTSFVPASPSCTKEFTLLKFAKTTHEKDSRKRPRISILSLFRHPVTRRTLVRGGDNICETAAKKSKILLDWKRGCSPTTIPAICSAPLQRKCDVTQPVNWSGPLPTNSQKKATHKPPNKADSKLRRRMRLQPART